MVQAINTEGKSLALIRKENDHETALREISKHIRKLNNFANATRKMNIEQIAITSDLILKEYWYLKLHEINFVFEQAMLGKYGKLYESLDGFKILEWFAEYDKARAEHCYNESLREHDKYNDERRK